MNEPKPLENRMTNAELADEIERILAEYHRAVELDDASLLPKIMSQWCDLFFKPGASAIIAALRQSNDKVLVPRALIEELQRILIPSSGMAFKVQVERAYEIVRHRLLAEAEGHHE